MFRWISSFLHRLFVSWESLERKAIVKRLRCSGQEIHPSVSFGRRVCIDVHEGGRIRIGPAVNILQDSWLIVESGDEMEIEENVFISQHCTVSGSVRIGKDTLIAGFVSIIDANHSFERTDTPIREQGGVKRPIRIGKDVWIGTMSVILAGVTIGDGAVIGANTTVTRDIPPGAIAVGCPARVVGWRGGP